MSLNKFLAENFDEARKALIDGLPDSELDSDVQGLLKDALQNIPPPTTEDFKDWLRKKIHEKKGLK